MIRLLLLSLVLATGACSMHRQPLPLPKGFYALEATQVEDTAASGWIGVEVESNGGTSLESLDYLPGVRVTSLVEGGPAAVAGLRVGDVLLRFAGTPTDDPDRLAALLRAIQLNATVEAEVQRGDQVMSATIEVGQQGGSRLRKLYAVDRSFLRVAFMDSEGQGAFPVVSHLAEDSPLHQHRVRVGDRIVALEGRDPGSASDFVRRLRQNFQPGEVVRLQVERDGAEPRQIEVRTWSPPMVMNTLGLWPVFWWDIDRVENRETFELGDLIFFSLFKIQRIGAVKHWSIFSLFHWETGRPELQTFDGEQ